jgi:phosphoribosylformimino-5-aminoimidazole carboxamide ribotide isomerase
MTASAPVFEILPSIDVRGGKVVDLYQGDFNRETVYEDTAEQVARQFAQAGTRWIHVVDLDGSRDGTGQNRSLVERIAAVAREAGIRLELGGGIRSLETIEAALGLGVTRVVIGTAAVEQPQLVTDAVRRFGAEAIVVGIDSRDGIVATRGWTEGSGIRATDMARQMAERGAVRFVCTDITRDSTLTEPNFASLEEIAGASRASVIASGGVTTVEQVRRLKGLGLEGAIIGSALYAGKLRLEDALATAAEQPNDNRHNVPKRT